MPATLRLMREGFGIELRRGRFEISVDDRSIGSLDYRDTVEAPVEPGHHTLRIRAGRVLEPRLLVRHGRRRSGQFPLSRGDGLATMGGVVRQAGSRDFAHARVTEQSCC